jgi:hypothetical protein
MRTALFIASIIMAAVKPDPAKTKIATKFDTRSVQIVVTLHDRAGNDLGPGYASRIIVSVNGAEPSHPSDNNDGTYVSAIPYSDDDPPKVTVSVDGVRVVTEWVPHKKKR